MSLLEDAQHFRSVAERCRAESLRHKLFALANALEELARVRMTAGACGSIHSASIGANRDCAPR